MIGSDTMVCCEFFFCQNYNQSRIMENEINQIINRYKGITNQQAEMRKLIFSGSQLFAMNYDGKYFAMLYILGLNFMDSLMSSK